MSGGAGREVGGERCGSSIPGVRSAWRRCHPSRGLKLQRSLCLPSRHLLLFFVFFTAAATQTPPIVNPPSALYWYHWSTSTSLITHFNITLYPISSFCRAKEMKKKENCHRVSCVCGVHLGVVVGALHGLQGGTAGRRRRGTAASLAGRLTLAPRHISGPFAVERFLKSHCLFLRERAGGESQRMEETAGCSSPDKVSSHNVPPATELALFYLFLFSLPQCCRAFPSTASPPTAEARA